MSIISQNILTHIKNPRHLQKNSLIICNHQKDTEQLKQDLMFFQTTGIAIHVFPDWETLIYDHFSPHQDIISERLSLLYDLLTSKPMVLIVSLNTILHQLAPISFLQKNVFKIKQGEILPLVKFKQYLIDAQYQMVSIVQNHGEFSCKGALIDVYPMGSTQPIRLEWFDDEIDSMRWFDIDTQLSQQQIFELNIFPAKEFGLDEEAIYAFRQRFREQFTVKSHECAIYEAVSNKTITQGLEYYLALFFEQTASLFDYLPPSFEIFYSAELVPCAEKIWQEVHIRYEQRRHDVVRPILKPEQILLTTNELIEKINNFTHTTLADVEPLSVDNIQIDRKHHQPFKNLKDFILVNTSRIIIVASSIGRREVINDFCKASDIFPKLFSNLQDFLVADDKLGLLHGPLAQAHYFTEFNILAITEHELFGETIIYQKQRRYKSSASDNYIRGLDELSKGMPIVHIDYGIGRFDGLNVITTQSLEAEFLTINYAGGDKIYVPIANLNLISKYNGSHPDAAPLHKLGSEHWKKEKTKAAEKIHDMAVEILETQAMRESETGFKYQLDVLEYEKFTSSFRFNETVDQKTTIDSILNDLQSNKPMDRLVCGDVGFGKTEVAMRAAFVVVQNNRQVCILVPTTLLAKQHFETFQERFADFPICIELISRFRTRAEANKVLKNLSDGKVDILVGTHKLLQEDVAFKDLGLLIVDEEHRFGVKQKEKLKKIQNKADILSLTATPIPRTLNLAMHGMRDLSIITTPPAKRLSVKTFWNTKSNSLIREALLREIMRGGQVFYLLNDTKSIARITDELKALVPEAKIEFAHGQMHERELEKIMADFYHQFFNVLVCTTIVETGIDIPTANTIIIERADKLGLAQLHQLRGRVGRSHHQAYAYLLTPEENLLTNDAKKRLEAIISLEDLGAGFALAMHDMEIRGAGDFLGEEQSGNINTIGYSLYMEMLEQAVNDIKSGKIPKFEKINQSCDINLNIAAIIPEKYMADAHQRLIFYKRISNCKTEQDIHKIQVELIDRFGLLPQPLKNLIKIGILRLSAVEIGIKRISFNKSQGTLEFSENPNINSTQLINLLQNEPENFKLSNQHLLQFKITTELTDEQCIDAIGELIYKIKN